MSTPTDLRTMIREELQKMLQPGGQSAQQPSAGQDGQSSQGAQGGQGAQSSQGGQDGQSGQDSMLQQLMSSLGQGGQGQGSGQGGGMQQPMSGQSQSSGQSGQQQVPSGMAQAGQSQSSGQNGQGGMLQQLMKSLGQGGQAQGGGGGAQQQNPLQQLVGPFQGQAALLLPVGGQAAGGQISADQLANDLRQQLQKLKTVIAETQSIAKRIESALQDQSQSPPSGQARQSQAAGKQRGG